MLSQQILPLFWQLDISLGSLVDVLDQNIEGKVMKELAAPAVYINMCMFAKLPLSCKRFSTIAQLLLRVRFVLK